MIFYKLKNIPAAEQTFLKRYLSEDLPIREVKYLWEKIADHKWLLGERLKRDVGFRVAAVDYIENFYEPVLYGARPTDFKNSLLEFLKTLSRTEFLRPKAL